MSHKSLIQRKEITPYFLEQEFEDLFTLDPYKKLSHEIRYSIKSEIQSGKYLSLKNPDNKIEHAVPLLDQRFRFNALPRKRVAAGNGKRNLDIGKLEILFFISGEFREEDPSKGFIASNNSKENPAHRLCVGCFPSLYLDSVEDYRSLKKLYDTYADFARDLHDCFSMAWPSLKEQLFDGDYESFARTSVPIVDYCLEQMKFNAKGIV